MNITMFDYRSGAKVAPVSVLDGIKKILSEVDLPIVNKGASKLKNVVIERLQKEGWTNELRLDPKSHITITSFFNGVGLCFQTGNVARIYADLLKLQALYMRSSINCGIIIVPQDMTAKRLGCNIATFERLLRELPIFRQVITMPIVVVGFQGKEVE